MTTDDRLAVTGHRPNRLGGYSYLIQRKLVDFAIKQIRKLEPKLVITGMAIGWDQAVAEACERLLVPWHAYVPFEGQELVWPTETQLEYHKLLGAASKKRIVCDGGYEAWKLKERNRAMVHDCTRLLALWSGMPGGTGHCVAFARQLGRPIINCWDQWRTYT